MLIVYQYKVFENCVDYYYFTTTIYRISKREIEVSVDLSRACVFVVTSQTPTQRLA